MRMGELFVETAWGWWRDHAHITSWVDDGPHGLAQAVAGGAHDPRHARGLRERDPRHAETVGVVVRGELNGEGRGGVVHGVTAVH